MSTAYYPQGMRAMPASGYNHRSTYLLNNIYHGREVVSEVILSGQHPVTLAL
jgi:hypothetical protein